MSDGGEGFLDALGGANRTTTVTGPLGDPVDAGWRLDGRRAVDRDGPGLGAAPRRRGRGQRPGRGLDLRHRRADRRGHRRRRPPGPRRRRRVGHDRRRARGAAGPAPAGPAQGRSSSSSPATSARRSSTPPTCSRPRRGPRRRRSSCCAGGSSGWPRSTPRSTASTCPASPAPAPPVGLAGGLAAVGAELVEGFEVVADEVDLWERIEGADLVVTGEGFLDAQSFEGKVVGGVAAMAEEARCPRRRHRRRRLRRRRPPRSRP